MTSLFDITKEKKALSHIGQHQVPEFSFWFRGPSIPHSFAQSQRPTALRPAHRTIGSKRCAGIAHLAGQQLTAPVRPAPVNSIYTDGHP